MDEVFDIVIIGSGPAGVSAALTARHRGKTALIITTAPEDSPLYRAEHVDNYPAMPSATGAQLVEAFVAHAERSGVKLMRGRALAVADRQVVKPRSSPAVFNSSSAYCRRTGCGSSRRTDSSQLSSKSSALLRMAAHMSGLNQHMAVQNVRNSFASGSPREI